MIPQVCSLSTTASPQKSGAQTASLGARLQIAAFPGAPNCVPATPIIQPKTRPISGTLRRPRQNHNNSRSSTNARMARGKSEIPPIHASPRCSTESSAPVCAVIVHPALVDRCRSNLLCELAIRLPATPVLATQAGRSATSVARSARPLRPMAHKRIPFGQCSCRLKICAVRKIPAPTQIMSGEDEILLFLAHAALAHLHVGTMGYLSGYQQTMRRLILYEANLSKFYFKSSSGIFNSMANT